METHFDRPDSDWSQSRLERRLQQQVVEPKSWQSWLETVAAVVVVVAAAGEAAAVVAAADCYHQTHPILLDY